MKLKRTNVTELDTEELVLGDKIKVSLDEYGDFTMTVHKITEQGALLIFNQIVTERPMNFGGSNKGGFQNSDLEYWLGVEFFNSFPKEFRKHIKEISVPSYGQIFGHDEFYDKYLESDDDEQLIFMKEPINRVAIYGDYTDWYWLKNAIKKEVSSTNFAYVNTCGGAASGSASYSAGVRPAILLDY